MPTANRSPKPPTDPETPGLSTSEGKLTLAVVILGLVLELSVVPLLQAVQASHPGALWVPVALGIAGGLLQVASVLGYQRARTQLKLGLISREAGFPVGYPPAPVVNNAAPLAPPQG